MTATDSVAPVMPPDPIAASAQASRAQASRALGLLMAIVFLGMLAIALPLPTLPVYVHDTLGYGPIVAGGAVAMQALATILTRHWAGGLTDAKGGRRAVFIGLPMGVAAGIVLLLATLLPVPEPVRLALVLLSRLPLGLAESLFLTGTMTWCIGRLGPLYIGRIMSWQGIAMFLAYGIGAPAALAAQARYGTAAVALAAIAAPLLALLLALRLAPIALPARTERVPFHRVIGIIWKPGLVLACGVMPFTSLTAFIALAYAAQGWTGAGYALTGFSAGFIGVRLVFNPLLDRQPAQRIAGWSLVVVVVGQALLWAAPNPAIAVAGAFFTGCGFSLIFPALGVITTSLVPVQMRGRAIGNFNAFTDLTVAITGPVCGAIAAGFGYPAIFLAGIAVALVGLAVLSRLRTPAPSAA